MPEPTDAEREQDIRAEHARADGTHASRMFNSERDFLLRLLDAERARADAAERAGAVKALRLRPGLLYASDLELADEIENGADL